MTLQINPLLQCDMYKVGHAPMYPKGTTKIYSNLTPRKSRMKGVNSVVVFGFQYMIMKYIMQDWTDNFFSKDKNTVLLQYSRMIDNTLGKGSITYDHIAKLHDLQYMPLHIKVLPEGSLCPIGVPCMTITNTVDHAYWLVNYLETIISCSTWQSMTSATIANEYRKLLSKWAIKTTGSDGFVQWQGHDFSMRDMSSLESACMSGAAHLLSFTGTDTIPAIAFLEKYYGANVEKELVGASVPATEHSVMCMGTKDDELETFNNLLSLYPTGILSVVSDTWDLWKVCTEYLPKLKDKILARNGKLVIRPDSGDPVDIICGEKIKIFAKEGLTEILPKNKGVVELLWNVFGGTINEQGYKVLDSHIGAIYGDSITLERANQICERLAAKGFASTNIVFGIGSYTYQYNTRDVFGFAVKATYGEITTRLSNAENDIHIEPREIFKDPITDDGSKKSAKGLLCVIDKTPAFAGPYRKEDRIIELQDQCTWEQEDEGLLETVFLNGKLIKFYTLKEIREKLKSQI